MKKILVLLLVFLVGCTSFAHEEHTQAGSKYVTYNDMTLLLKENPDTGMVAIDFIIKHSIAADGTLPGLNNFVNNMLLAGTQTRTREQINKEIESVGGSISARTYAEYNEIMIEVPSDHVSDALLLLQDVVRNPSFDTEEIEKEREQILSEIESKKDQPHIVAEEKFMEQMFFDHPYMHPIDGYEKSVKKITREDIINHYKTWYVPNNFIVAVVGNIREKPTANALQQLFETMTPKETPRETFLSARHNKPTISKTDMPIESMYIHFGYQTVPASHPDFIKTRMAQAVLGSGSGSRLFYNLRDKQALAYTVYAMAPSIRSNGFLKVVMISRPQVLNQSLLGISNQTLLLKEELVSEEELNLVKQKIRGFFFLDHQKTKDQSNYLGFYELQGLGYEWDVQYPDALSRVTPEEVQYAARKYFVNPQVAVVGPFREDIIR